MHKKEKANRNLRLAFAPWAGLVPIAIGTATPMNIRKTF